MSKKFPNRVVLGEGYPWANGVSNYKEVTMKDKPIGGVNLEVKFPSELWSKDVPRYRLVLEMVKPPKKKKPKTMIFGPAPESNPDRLRSSRLMVCKTAKRFRGCAKCEHGKEHEELPSCFSDLIVCSKTGKQVQCRQATNRRKS